MSAPGVLCTGRDPLARDLDGRPAPIALTAGETHACALTADGCAWCWGDDRKGQLGDGRIPATDAVVGVRPVLLSCR